ncbi:hypothetical protein [Nostoc flagelliforme]|uniref:hypothetical protein n=1 Tax=Nostoc flagelliforme TaxID=1306274 RepID=UPI0012FE72E9
MFDYSGYREVERDNEGYKTCDRFSELHLRLNLTLFKQPLRTNCCDNDKIPTFFNASFSLIGLTH